MKAIPMLLVCLAAACARADGDSVSFAPPDQKLTDTKHRVNIRRVYADADQARLILAAESAQPERDAVARAMTMDGREALTANPTDDRRTKRPTK